MTENYKIALLFLGSPQVIMAGEDTTEQITAKHLALVAYISSSAPDRLARNKLASLFWSEKSDEASRYRLRHALWELRRTIGDNLLQADDRTCWLCLDDGVKVDVLEFKAGCAELESREKRLELGIPSPTPSNFQSLISNLSSIAALYRGDLLDGINVHEAPLFEEWLLAERERLQLSYLDVLWYLSKAQVSAGRLEDAVRTLSRLIEADPLRERSYRALMGVYLRQGDKTAALKVYERCASVLHTELGVAPSPATEQVRRVALQEAPASADAELDRASRLFQEGKRQEAWDICVSLEATASDAVIISQAALLRAEIALAEGKQTESLSLVRAARRALGKLFRG